MISTRNKIILILVGIVLLAAAGSAYLLYSGTTILYEPQERIIETVAELPNTTTVSARDGGLVGSGVVAIPLVPTNGQEKISVPNAIFTVKGVYELSTREATKWSADAQPSFIKSLGALTLEGKSNQWQAVFVSTTKGKGYEILIQKDRIVSQKEVASDAKGAPLPNTWFDSNETIRRLQALPQFADATITSLTFFYNTDALEWRYGLATSEGDTSISLH